MSEHAAPRAHARSEYLAGCTSPRGAARDSASVVSSPSDSAAGGNDAGAPRAQVPGGEGEPHSRYRDARLGSTDKELKAGATNEGSAPGALGSPRQRTPRVKVMDPARAPQNQLPRPCLVLVLLNPRGGKGKALQLFRSHVQPLLAQADVSFRLLLTERRNHARELVRTEELGRWDALVVMSGDGVMHEVVNGLMERPDWETAIRKPLCSLPAGSGNALAASLNHYAGDPVWLAGPRSLGGGRGGRMRTFSLQLRAGDERRPPEQLHPAAVPQAAGPHEPAVPAHALGAAGLLRAQPGLGLHRRRGHREREVPAPRGEALHGGHPPSPGGPARLPRQTGLPPCRAGGLRGARPPSSGPAGPAGPRGRPPRAPGGAGARSLDGGAGAGLRAGSGAAALTPGQRDACCTHGPRWGRRHAPVLRAGRRVSGRAAAPLPGHGEGQAHGVQLSLLGVRACGGLPPGAQGREGGVCCGWGDDGQRGRAGPGAPRLRLDGQWPRGPLTFSGATVAAAQPEAAAADTASRSFLVTPQALLCLSPSTL